MLSSFYNFRFGNTSMVGVGASTSICAIIGIMLANIYLSQKYLGDTNQAKKKILSMTIYILLISLIPNVDFFGHFGSLISGFLIGLSFLSVTVNGRTVNQNTIGIDRLKILAKIIFIIYTMLLLLFFIV